MTAQHLVFTIDGAAGTGKTTVARELAKRLGTECLDTGAMYRAVAVPMMQRLWQKLLRRREFGLIGKNNPPQFCLVVRMFQ